jgi:hypothetical protein
MFKKLNKLKKHHQFLYSLVIATAIIGIWRGLWMLLDLYLFPKNEALSASVSLIIGILILAGTHHKLS